MPPGPALLLLALLASLPLSKARFPACSTTPERASRGSAYLASSRAQGLGMKSACLSMATRASELPLEGKKIQSACVILYFHHWKRTPPSPPPSAFSFVACVPLRLSPWSSYYVNVCFAYQQSSELLLHVLRPSFLRYLC